jgi:ligand-binding sensor domain-containing protein
MFIKPRLSIKKKRAQMVEVISECQFSKKSKALSYWLIKAQGVGLSRYALQTSTTLLFFLFPLLIRAQENIPLGNWRIHLSFNSVSYLASGESKIFAATKSGVLEYDVQDGSSVLYSTLNALSTTGISTLAYDEIRKQLIIGYENGALDFINAHTARNFTSLVNPADITVSPKINHVSVNGSIAYISTNYGVIVYDLTRDEIRESWRNLGSAGQLLAIATSALKNDSIYLATANGVLAGKLTDNLLDFTKWTRYTTGDFNTSIQSITLFNNKVYAAVNGEGVYQFTGTGWMKELIIPVAAAYTFLKGNDEVLLTGGDGRAWKMDRLRVIKEITDPRIKNINNAVILFGKEWVADEDAGLLSNQSGTWETYLPNGPSASYVFNAKFVNNSIVVTHGGFNGDYQQQSALKAASIFDKGLWSTLTTQLGYLSDVEQGNLQSIFLASFGEGLEQLKVDGTRNVYTSDNSPLENSIANTTSIYITDIENSPQGLWVANYGANKPLHLLKADNTWESFSYPSARYPFKLAVDFNGNVWMLLSRDNGGGISVVKQDGAALRTLSDLAGSGLLPDKEVLSVAVDNDGYIWIGTAKGICYFIYADEDAIRPIVEGGYLLGDEKVNAIAVDGGNRKWVGTERGLWLFNATGETTIYNFTTHNSPLPSDIITDIEINSVTGEVFISTEQGLVSFRADATTGQKNFDDIKIFPNPVTQNFIGLVGISGLYTDATIKITDASGKLVNQLQANGGTASWNVTDFSGKRVSTGVYLVLAAAGNGSESVASKIVVVD